MLGVEGPLMMTRSSTLYNPQRRSTRGMSAHILTSALACASLMMVGGCEEEIPMQNVSRPRAVNQSVGTARVSTAQYQVEGLGPKEAPPWIKDQDVSVMRLYCREDPKGYRNGNTFEPKDVWIERREDGWYLILNEMKLTHPTQLTLEGQRVELPLGDQIDGQLKVRRSFEDSVARWQLPSDTFVLGKTRTWSSENHFAVELLDWRVKPYQKSGGAFQVAGSASGRLVTHFLDSKGVEGWVMGRFEEIPVRYMGDPSAW